MAVGAQRRQRGKPQHTGPHLRFSGCAGRRSVRFSLLPFCQTASAFRLICLFHTFFRRGVYRAMVFVPLRCPNLFRFPFALFVGCSFQLFCLSLMRIRGSREMRFIVRRISRQSFIVPQVSYAKLCISALMKSFYKWKE